MLRDRVPRRMSLVSVVEGGVWGPPVAQNTGLGEIQKAAKLGTSRYWRHGSF